MKRNVFTFFWILFILIWFSWFLKLEKTSDIFIIFFCFSLWFLFLKDFVLEKMKNNSFKEIFSKKYYLIFSLFTIFNFILFWIFLEKTDKSSENQKAENVKILAKNIENKTQNIENEIIKTNTWESEKIKEKSTNTWRTEQKEKINTGTVVGGTKNEGKEESIEKKNLYKVKTIIDWDTFEFERDWKILKARMIWIDAPESSKTRLCYIEQLWTHALEQLKDFIFDKNVEIEYDDSQGNTDIYWRQLVYVFFNWKNIWEEMIKSGYAKEYTYNKKYKYQENFKKAKQIAKENKLWIWSLENIKTTEQKKQENKVKNSSWKIKWNINSKWKKIYHLPWCRSYEKTRINLDKWEKYFETEQDAINEWFIKANNCN